MREWGTAMELVVINDYWTLIAIAAGFGAIGGLVFELLLPVRGQIGRIEIPSFVKSNKKRRWIDLGVFASVIVGAVAAVAVLYFFPPQIALPDDASNAEAAKTGYDLIKTIALSLIAGSAGGSFISAMQARVLVQVKDAEAASTKAQLKQISDQAGEEKSPSLKTSLDALISGIDDRTGNAPGDDY